jgi:hypothetical protein
MITMNKISLQTTQETYDEIISVVTDEMKDKIAEYNSTVEDLRLYKHIVLNMTDNGLIDMMAPFDYDNIQKKIHGYGFDMDARNMQELAEEIFTIEIADNLEK